MLDGLEVGDQLSFVNHLHDLGVICAKASSDRALSSQTFFPVRQVFWQIQTPSRNLSNHHLFCRFLLEDSVLGVVLTAWLS